MAPDRSTRVRATPLNLRKVPMAIGTLLIAVGLVVAIVGVRSAGAADATVGLGTAAPFAVLAGSTVTNTGPSVISGDVGVSPGTAVTGFPPGTVNNGTIHSADAVALQAQNDATTAFNDAAGRASTGAITAPLGGGQVLVSGVYTGGALALNGALTLNAQGDPNAVFIFQAASTLVTASASSVILINGASPCNVFWEVGSSATLGTASTFIGTILASTAITATTGATIEGRLLASTAAVTLDTNTITAPICSAPPPTTTTTTVAPTTTTTIAPPPTTTTVPVTPTTTGGGSGIGGTGTGTGGTGTGTGASGTGTGNALTSTGGATGSGGVGSTGSVSPTSLAYTGAQISTTLLAGLAVILFGGTVLLLAAWRPSGAHAHSVRTGRLSRRRDGG